tara:strand:- start:266 stop:637 length:372 start_codon:yes stop_codon:yes gene_type:complete
MKTIIKNISLFLSLFTSSSTLICCALPALFVGLGAGAVFAGLTSSIPQLIWISENKTGVFVLAGILIGISGYFEYLNKESSCDLSKQEICVKTRTWSKKIWLISLVFYFIGLFFAFLLPRFFL